MTSVLINTDLDNAKNINMLEKGMIYINFCFYLNIFTGKNKCTIIGNPIAVDADSLLMDVDIQSIEDNLPTCEDKTQDIDQFFHTAIMKDVNGTSKKYCACKLCV